MRIGTRRIRKFVVSASNCTGSKGGNMAEAKKGRKCAKCGCRIDHTEKLSLCGKCADVLTDQLDHGNMVSQFYAASIIAKAGG